MPSPKHAQRTAGVDVERTLRTASANGANGQVRGALPLCTASAQSGPSRLPATALHDRFLERTVYKRDPRTGLCTQRARSSSGCLPQQASRPNAETNGYADIGALRMAATTCATSPSPKTPPASERTQTSPPACVPSPTTLYESAAATTFETHEARRPRSRRHPQYARDLSGLNSPDRQPPSPN